MVEMVAYTVSSHRIYCGTKRGESLLFINTVCSECAFMVHSTRLIAHSDELLLQPHALHMTVVQQADSAQNPHQFTTYLGIKHVKIFGMGSKLLASCKRFIHFILKFNT